MGKEKANGGVFVIETRQVKLSPTIGVVLIHVGTVLEKQGIKGVVVVVRLQVIPYRPSFMVPNMNACTPLQEFGTPFQ